MKQTWVQQSENYENIFSKCNFNRGGAESDESTISITNVCDECMTYVQRNVNTLNATNFVWSEVATET